MYVNKFVFHVSQIKDEWRGTLQIYFLPFIPHWSWSTLYFRCQSIAYCYKAEYTTDNHTENWKLFSPVYLQYKEMFQVKVSYLNENHF